MALNVLVVDDSSVMRTMVIKSLRLSGLPLNQIYQASNGAEALGILEENWIDLTLLDINMPVMNGEEMLRRVRENSDTADLPIVIISTEGSDTRIAAFKRQGAEFLHKPFTPERLRDIVINLTGVSHDELVEDETAAGSGPDF